MKKKALIVGINNYPDSPLRGCVNDANVVGKELLRNGDGSINFSIRTEHNVQQKGVLRGMIEECFSGGIDIDIALFYFSGHGHIDSVGGYIVTPDYSKHDVGVSMQEILTIANDSKCRNRIVVLDCCHSGFLGSISTSGQTTSMINEGVTILTASKSNESAMEISGEGVFTSLFVDALAGGAADITGNITPGGIYAYIDKALGPWAQRPVFKTNVNSFSPIKKVKPLVNEEVIRRLIEYFDDPTFEVQLNPSYEPTNALHIKHKVVKPYAIEDHVNIFSDLQQLEGVGLVVPVGEKHMYYAAMNSKSCKLTPCGQHYWRLVKEKLL